MKTTLVVYLIFYKLYIFRIFVYISRTYNQINYRNMLFAKLTITFFIMAQVFFFHVSSKKDPHLNATHKTCFINFSEFLRNNDDGACFQKRFVSVTGECTLRNNSVSVVFLCCNIKGEKNIFAK